MYYGAFNALKGYYYDTVAPFNFLTAYIKCFEFRPTELTHSTESFSHDFLSLICKYLVDFRPNIQDKLIDTTNKDCLVKAALFLN